MNRNFLVLSTVLTLLALLLSVPGTLAQGPELLTPPRASWFLTPQETGGPDGFGYTWDNSASFNWIDATVGTNTGLSQGSWGADITGSISLGFEFKFYENTYTEGYISSSGAIGFDPLSLQDVTGTGYVPSPSAPDNFIAPYLAWLLVNSGGYQGQVYYLRGGTAPNRYFVVEWYEVNDDCDGVLTFEVILWENGDVVFQYLSMDQGDCRRSGTVAGIESSEGLYGLAYRQSGFNDMESESSKAVLFNRPAPSARVGVWPDYQGRFTHAGETETFQILIHNHGELGVDTYDLAPSSTFSVSLHAANGTLLTDTDGDGVIDTGSVAQGGSTTVVARVTAPPVVNVGDHDIAAITARSSLDTGQTKTTFLQTAAPAPFAQVFQDNADWAMSLYLIQPDAQGLQKFSSENVQDVYGMAVAETPSGFAYFWTKSRSVGSTYVTEIEYTLLDRYGQAVRGVGKLTDHSGATMTTYDYSPAVAVASNGRIGVIWYRYLYNPSNYNKSYNIYYAILDASGNVVVPSTNLTNNPLDDYHVPSIGEPRIAATGGNRFVLAWHRDQWESGGSLNDIYYALRDTNGGEIKPVTRFTSDTPGSDQSYHYPALAQLNGDRALLAWSQTVSGVGDTAYAILDSSGDVVKSTTTLGRSGSGLDAVQLSNGRVLIAWTFEETTNPHTSFALLEANSYNLVAGPTSLDNPASPAGNDYVSVTADAAGHAILTWMDRAWEYRHNLYYALVDGDGSVLTAPMIFRTTQALNLYTSNSSGGHLNSPCAPAGGPLPSRDISTSDQGYGNTSYSLVTPTTSDVDARVTSSALVGGAPGGTAFAPISVGNHGLTPATLVVLTATLDSNLGYAGASPMPSSVSGDTVVWDLPDIDFLGDGRVVLYTTVPSTTFGNRYPVNWMLASAGPEADLSDNTALTEVMVARQVFLPVVVRNY
jgi:hypothetical protein